MKSRIIYGLRNKIVTLILISTLFVGTPGATGSQILNSQANFSRLAWPVGHSTLAFESKPVTFAALFLTLNHYDQVQVDPEPFPYL